MTWFSTFSTLFFLGLPTFPTDFFDRFASFGHKKQQNLIFLLTDVDVFLTFGSVRCAVSPLIFHFESSKRRHVRNYSSIAYSLTIPSPARSFQQFSCVFGSTRLQQFRVLRAVPVASTESGPSLHIFSHIAAAKHAPYKYIHTTQIIPNIFIEPDQRVLTKVM